MVIPVGDRFTVQELLLVRKNAAGEPSIEKMLPVRFVPVNVINLSSARPQREGRVTAFAFHGPSMARSRAPPWR